MPAGTRAGVGRHQRRGEAEPGGLGQPALDRRRPGAPRRPGRPRRARRWPAGAARRGRPRPPRARSRGRRPARSAARRRPSRCRRRRCRAGPGRAAPAPPASSRPGPSRARLTARRGVASVERATSACTSATSGRRPSRVTVTQVPGTGLGAPGQEQPGRVGQPARCRRRRARSSRPRRPGRTGSSTARTSRSVECRSPSNCSTTSTRCSSTRGPAIAPSLVTCPTSTVAMPRSLATAISAAATARTWVTPPAVPSTAGEAIVCTESTTSRPGSTASTWPSTRGQVGLGGEVAAAGCSAPMRSARSRTWAADSSPVTYQGGAGRPRAPGATSSSSVDLPTPGSPASSTTAPGTRPPPSTRSSSPTPVRPGPGRLDVDLGDRPRRRR